MEVLSAGDDKPIYYNPPYRPRFPSYLFLVEDSTGKRFYSGVSRSEMIDSLRPWWASLRRLDPRIQPIDISRTVALLLLLAAAGSILMIPDAREDRESDVGRTYPR